jgi:hypothetical protein
MRIGLRQHRHVTGVDFVDMSLDSFRHGAQLWRYSGMSIDPNGKSCPLPLTGRMDSIIFR